MAMFSIRQPDVRPVGDRLWMLRANWWAAVDLHGVSYRFVFSAPDLTDLMSIPRPFWSIMGLAPDGTHRAAALIHDGIYRQAGITGNVGSGQCVFFPGVIDRKTADQIFVAVAGICGMDQTRRNICYAILRMFGRKHWGGPIPSTE